VKLADIEFATRDGVMIAVLRGEIDMSNAQDLGVALAEATSNELLGLVLDLSEIHYMDSAGIHLIYRLRESLQSRGQTLTLVIPAESPVNDALRLAGVERHVEFIATLDEALSTLGLDAPAGH
jgi:anti-anti-sigma factor